MMTPLWVESRAWLVTGAGAPLAAVVLCWAVLVLRCSHGSTNHWRRPLDPLLVALLVEAVLHQVAASLHAGLALLRPESEVWCSLLAWLLQAVRTMQAGTLTSLALARCFRHRPLLVYHLICLAVLSSSVGVAAVLARVRPCHAESDRRYIVFWLGLHTSLAVGSVVALFSTCCRLTSSASSSASTSDCRVHRRQLLNSSSDLSSALSDISMISTMRSRSTRVAHSVSDCSARVTHSVSDCSARARRCLVEELLRISPANEQGGSPPITYLDSGPDTSRLHYSSSFVESGSEDLDYGAIAEPCYGSTTNSASSTNSRAPCLHNSGTSVRQELPLCTVLSVLGLCYFVNHIPVLVLTVLVNYFPWVMAAQQLPLEYVPLWCGLLEGFLLPLVLALADKAFQKRVAAVYTRHRPSDISKPLQGLHGKFRPFNNSLLDCQRPTTETVRFPLTNGSLFTSLDGRIPVIHHYRRCKGVRTSALPPYCLNLNLAARFPHSMSAVAATGAGVVAGVADGGGSASQLHANLVSAASVGGDESNVFRPRDEMERPAAVASTQCLLTQRLSTTDLRGVDNIRRLRESLFLDAEATTSEDEDGDDEEDDGEAEEPLYATLSSRSVCSATTAANDDFEFYQRRFVSSSSSVDTPHHRQGENRRKMSLSSDVETSQVPIRQQQPLYRQQPVAGGRRRLGVPPTPPPPRRLAPVLSVDSLVAALSHSDVSYLDTGDVCRHSADRSGSVPDLKKVFYTGFL
ncbi:uncharacterized protein LOC111049349 [Nilaparvata lugens]|uniref:uncharacterized protein LOC111049349 n=1 Tax=Nilaparvata lugens TaxID=108931 RepID=UPI00193DC547|nr:uncharacterized protein LOC111049349 [Nilaparvata lugens]XP_039292394.1 uncharacterized protein LOC111049349 [Nilaparvata lugens]